MYRVHPLPESMRPLVWDFGQLIDDIEEHYTTNIVRRFVMTSTPVVSIRGVGKCFIVLSNCVVTQYL